MELFPVSNLSEGLLNNMRDAVILIDSRGLVAGLNPEAEKLTGWAGNDARGRNMAEVFHLLHPETHYALALFCERALSGKDKGNFSVDTPLVALDGSEKHVRGTVFAVGDDNGDISGLVIIIHAAIAVRSDADDLSFSGHDELPEPGNTGNLFRYAGDSSLRFLFHAIPESLFLINREGIIIEANESFASRFGRHREECLGVCIYDLFTPDIAGSRRETVEEVLKTGKCLAFDSEVNGQWRRHNVCPVEGSAGEVERLVVFSLDITTLKHTGENLNEAQYRLDADLKAMSKLHEISILFVREGNMDEIFSKVIDTALAITGAAMGNIRLFDPKTGHLKIAGQKGFDHPLREFCDNSGDQECLCDMALRRNERVIIEDISQSPLVSDREELEEHLAAGVKAVQSTPLRSRNGKLLGILSTYFRTPHRPDDRMLKLLDLLASLTSDIIERAEKEEALRQSEEHRRLAQDAAKSGSWAWDLQTNRSVWSEEIWALYGLEPQSIEPGYEAWALTIHPDDRANVEMKVQEASRNGSELQAEWRVPDREGGERWLMSRGRAISDAWGKPVKMIGIVMDITDRKRSEELLQESNERHRSLFNNMLNGVAYCRMIFEDGRPVDFIHEEVNSRFEILTGLKKLVGRKATEVIAGIRESNPELIERFGRVVLTGSADRFEMYFESLQIWLDITAYRAKKGCFVAVFDVITERKLAEKALRESEKKFRSITEQMAEVVFVADSAGYLTYVSKAVEMIFGYQPHEVTGHFFTEYLAEEEISRALEIFRDTLLNNRADQIAELRFRKKNRSFFYGEVHVHYYQDHDITGMIGLIRDITDRKRNERIRQKYEQKLLESRQFLQNIYDAVNHSIFVVDVLADGSYRYKGINRRHEAETGISSEEIAGKKPEDLLEAEAAEAVISHYDACVRRGGTLQYIERLMFQGKESWWETTLNPVRNDTGSIYRIIGTASNITERKLAGDELKKLSVAVEQSPAVVVITDPDGNIEYVNPTFTQHTGYEFEEVKGQNPRILKSDEMPKEVYEDLWQKILSGEVWYGEFHNRKKNGELYWEEAVISAIRNEDGAITNFVAVKEDITEKKKLWNDLILAKEKAEESNRLKSAFLANISHEIRTPMNGILGFSELLKDPTVSGEEQTEYIELIHQSGLRLLDLINDLIDISRIEAGETIVQITATSVNTLLADLFVFFKPQATSRGLQLHLTPGLQDDESIIETDRSKLSQVLTNLVQNALKFTIQGSVTFGYTRKDEMLEFSVIDTGIGIHDDMKEKIFERFRQADNSLTRSYEGSGLGLSISRGYVEMLGGTIRVESVSGRGSGFFFTLPYNAPGFLKMDVSPSDDQEPAVLSPGLTIVVAEDDEVSSFLLQQNLKGENITIFSAVTGLEAVELVRCHPEISLVLMDIQMPVMDGFEATRQIKQLRPGLPVIAQTAFTTEEGREMATKAGCDALITKPIKRRELLDLMKELLQR